VKTSLSSLLVLSAVLVGSYIAASLLIPTQRGGETAAAFYGEGDENPSARAAWELRRLYDPATGRLPDDIRRKELAYAATLPMRDEGAIYAKGSSVAEYGWSGRGPYNIGGRTRALGVDITGEDTIVAAGVSGGFWRSSNRGTSWTHTSLPTQLPTVTSLVQDVRPGKTHIWYAGTGEIIGQSASADGAYYLGDGIFKSIDNGRSWSPLASTTTGTPASFDKRSDFIWRMATDPSKPDTDVVYAAMYDAVGRSSDGGTSWRYYLTGTSTASSYVDVAVTSRGVVYAALDSRGDKRGIWRSTDGVRYTRITMPDVPTNFNRFVIGVAPSDERTVYFLAETPRTGHLGRNFQGDSVWASLWRYQYDSGDGSGTGGRWTNLSANLPSFGSSFGDYNPQSSYDMFVRVQPDDPNVVYIGGTNVYRSTSGFTTPDSTTWIGGYRDIPIDKHVLLKLEYENHHPDLHWLLFSPTDPHAIYTGSDGGVHRSNNGLAPQVEWSSLNNGYMTSQFYTVAIDNATPGSNFILGGLQDNGTWSTSVSDQNAPWVQRGSGDGSYCAVVDGGRTLYVSKQLGRTYRVDLDASGTMTGFARIDPLEGRGYDFINPFALDPVDQRIVYLLGNAWIWRNSDAAAIPVGTTDSTAMNWTRLNATRTLLDTVGNQDTISALGVSTAAPAHRVWFGTNHGRLYRIDNADTGQPVPVEVTGSGFPKNGNGRPAYINNIAVDPENGDIAIVVFSNYAVQSLFMTTDGGQSWTAIGGNLEQQPSGAGNGPSCRWVTMLHRSNGTLYLVGTSTGIYSTEKINGAATLWWQEGSTTIGNVVVDMIVARPSDGLVVAATHGNGIFATTIAQLGVREPSSPARGGISLEANRPNPARGSTSIDYTLPEALADRDDVTLILYDMLGREIYRHRESGGRSVGRHTIHLDFSSGSTPGPLPAGRYHYRLQSGDQTATRSMQIVK
jgi:hypothetical protein